MPSHKLPTKITACRIMRDLERADAPSRGYGFVEFQNHAHALAALRWTNNNPSLTEIAQGGVAAVRQRVAEKELPRLIVEFAVENRGKLRMQEKRREAAIKRLEQRKNLAAAEEIDDADTTFKNAPKKLSRGQRQREKRRQRREEVENNGGDLEMKIETSEYLQEQQPRTKRAHVTAAQTELRRHVGGERKNRAQLAVPETDDREIEQVIYGGQAFENGRKVEKKRKQKQKSKGARKESCRNMRQDFDALVSDYKNRLFQSKDGRGDGKDIKQRVSRWFEE